MIDPNLDDPYTRERYTELAWSENAFGAVGLSLAVILKTPAFEGHTWHSLEYGQGNLLLLSLKGSYECKPPDSDEDCANSYLREGERIHEFALPPEARRDLGFSLDPHELRHRIEHLESVVYEVLAHDNFIISVRPVDERMLRDILFCVLGLHSFYLGCDVDWSGVLDRFVDVVKSGRRIEVRSCPSNSEVEVKQVLSRSLWEKLLFRPPDCVRVRFLVRDGVAVEKTDS